jgi:hypothetical protein
MNHKFWIALLVFSWVLAVIGFLAELSRMPGL